MRISDGSSDVCYSELGGEDLVDPLGRGDSPLRAGEDHAEHPQRPDEHRHVEVERDQVTYGEVPLDHLVAAVGERGDEPQVRQELERWQRSEEHTSELQSLMRISYAVFCLKKKKEHKSTDMHQE